MQLKDIKFEVLKITKNEILGCESLLKCMKCRKQTMALTETKFFLNNCTVKLHAMPFTIITKKYVTKVANDVFSIVD